MAALLTLASSGAAAQFGHGHPFSGSEAPEIVTDFGAGRARALNEAFAADFHVPGIYAGKRRLDRFSNSPSVERPTPWRVYGRLGVLNFQREVDPQYSRGLRFSWRRTGPRLAGRVYVGIHRTFD